MTGLELLAERASRNNLYIGVRNNHPIMISKIDDCGMEELEELKSSVGGNVYMKDDPTSPGHYNSLTCWKASDDEAVRIAKDLKPWLFKVGSVEAMRRVPFVEDVLLHWRRQHK